MSTPAIALPSVQVVLDGETYTIRTLDAYVASALYCKFLNTLGGALASLGAVEGKGTGELGVIAAGALLAKLSPELFREVRDTFAASCSVQKGDKNPELKNIFAIHFAGKMAHMSKWMLECMKVNFADFLEGDLVDQITAKFKKAMGTSDESPPTGSTGSSTES